MERFANMPRAHGAARRDPFAGQQQRGVLARRSAARRAGHVGNGRLYDGQRRSSVVADEAEDAIRTFW
jgi:hypothetical protein